MVLCGLAMKTLNDARSTTKEATSFSLLFVASDKIQQSNDLLLVEVKHSSGRSASTHETHAPRGILFKNVPVQCDV
jgi:hypothetical protein